MERTSRQICAISTTSSSQTKSFRSTAATGTSFGAFPSFLEMWLVSLSCLMVEVWPRRTLTTNTPGWTRIRSRPVQSTVKLAKTTKTRPQRLRCPKSTTEEPRPTAKRSRATPSCSIMEELVMIPGNASLSSATTVSARVSAKASTAFNTQTVTRSCFVQRQQSGLGKIHAPSCEPLMNSARKLMSVPLRIIAGMPQTRIRRRQSRNVCHYTRRIMAPGSAGKAKTTLSQLLTTTNTTASTASQALLSPIMKLRTNTRLGALQQTISILTAR